MYLIFLTNVLVVLLPFHQPTYALVDHLARPFMYFVLVKRLFSNHVSDHLVDESVHFVLVEAVLRGLDMDWW